MSFSSKLHKLTDHRCMILLIVFTSYLCLEPILFDFLSIDMYSMLIFYLILIYSPAIITLNKKYFYIITLLLVLALGSYTAFLFFNIKTFFYLTYIFSCITDILAVLIIVFHVLSKDIKTKEDLFASIIVFLLIGGTFGDIFYSLEKINPGSLYFTLSKTAILDITINNIQQLALNYRDVLYFSFCTITTLGYGDIVPHTATAKRLACIEACIGVLYIAIFIGRIVGGSISAKKRTKD